MKERPIIFSAPMVRAILDGQKWQTRRIIKFRGRDHYAQPWMNAGFVGFDGESVKFCDNISMFLPIRFPYGVIGDRLWVREAIYFSNEHDNFYYQADNKGVGTKRYLALKASSSNLKTIQAMFMPRWASRITLEITDVRVQRLQDISGDDAIAEGCGNEHGDREIAISDYVILWESINGKDSWDANPWVWALSFKRIEPVT